MSHIHRVVRGTGTPKDEDEVNRRKVCECHVLSETVKSPCAESTVGSCLRRFMTHFRFRTREQGVGPTKMIMCMG